MINTVGRGSLVPPTLSLIGATAMSIYTAKYSQDKKFYVYDYLRSRKSKFGDIGSPYYVGKGKENRAYEKHQKGIYLPKDKGNILVSSVMNEADSFQLEMFKIHLLGRIDLNTGLLRNKTFGGDGPVGVIRSEETKNKMKIAKQNMTDETKSKMSKSQTGKQMSLESKKKIGNYQSGKIRSLETRKKMSAWQKGKKLSVAHKQKLSEAKLGKPSNNRKST